MIDKQIKEYISCPQFGDNHYGKWGCLNLEQRRKIKQLLNKIDNLEMIENKYIDLQTRWNSLREFVIQLQKLKGINQQGFSWGVAQEVLDKMNELEKE